jgi:uncharacterized damage-inducible protein DinB
MTAYGAPQLASSFRTVRNNTIQIAEDIPEDKYSFVAAPGTQSVGWLLSHIAFGPKFYQDIHKNGITTFQGFDFPAAFVPIRALEDKPRSKAEIVGLLKSEGEKFASWLDGLTPEFLAETYTDHAGQNPTSRLTSLHSPKEHEMHHRGQLMLIQRMLGIVPHLTRAREERQRQAAAAQKS